jgi:hypothetical protein
MFSVVTAVACPTERQLIVMDNHKSKYTAWDIEVAKRIACAVVSYQVGLDYEDLWPQYADQREEVGTFWLSFAKQIREELPDQPK